MFKGVINTAKETGTISRSEIKNISGLKKEDMKEAEGLLNSMGIQVVDTPNNMLDDMFSEFDTGVFTKRDNSNVKNSTPIKESDVDFDFSEISKPLLVKQENKVSSFNETTEEVPIELLKGLHGNRQRRTKEELQELTDSIAKEGVNSPIILRYDPETKRANVGEGNHRLAVAEFLGKKTIPVRVARKDGGFSDTENSGDLSSIAKDRDPKKHFGADMKFSNVFNSPNKKMVAAAAAGVATTAQADDNSPSSWMKRTSDDSISYNLRESINPALNSLEATKFTTYVPKDEKGVVIGKSGVTIAKGFDLGQVDLAGLKKLNFSESLFNKLSKYAGYKGQEALDFLSKEGSLTLTKEEVKEINSKVGEREEKKLVENFKEYTGRDFDKEPKNVQQALMLASYQVGSGLFMNPDKKNELGEVIEKGKITDLTKQLRAKEYEDAGDNLYNWNNKSKKGLVKRYRLQGKIMKGELDPSDIDAFNLESENTLNLLNEKEDEGKNIYTISSGDGLGKIAKKFNTTVENLMKLNNIKNRNDTIKTGAKLKTK